MLEVAAGGGDADALVHDPLADVEVRVDPLLDVLVVGDLVGVETGAAVPDGGLVSLVALWGRKWRGVR